VRLTPASGDATSSLHDALPVLAFGSPQGNERVKRIQIAIVGDAYPRFAAFILYPKAPQAQAIQQILVVADKPQHVAVILLLQQRSEEHTSELQLREKLV